MASLHKAALLPLVLVLALPAVAAGLVLALVLSLHTEPGERWLAERLERAVSAPGAEIDIAGLEVRWPLDLHAGRIAVADGQGQWLAAEDVALDWSPLRLLTGVFAAERLSAERIVVARRPLPAEAEVAPPGIGGALQLPRLPVGVAIERIDADVLIDEAVGGQPVALHLGGTARLTGSDADIDLALRRTDGQPGSATALVAYDQDTSRLTVDIAVDEALGAAVAGMMAADLPPIALRVAGEGPLSDWRGSAVATTGGRACIEADLRLTGRDELGIQVEGEALPECLPWRAGGVPDSPAAPQPRSQPASEGLGEGALRFRGDATVGEDETRIGEVEIETPEGTVRFGGTLAGDAISLRFSLDSDDVARLAALGGVDLAGAAHVSGTMLGTRSSPVIEAQLSSAGGQAYGIAWRELSSRFSLRKRSDDADAPWLLDGSGSMAAAEGLPGPLTGPLTMAVTAAVDPARKVVNIGDLRLHGPGTGVSLFGVVRDWGSAAALHGLVRSERLQAFGDVVGLDLAGRAAVRFSARGDLLTPDLHAAFAGTAADFRTGLAQVDALLGAAPEVSGALALSANGLPVLRLRLAGAGATLTAGGRVTDSLGLGWRLSVPDLALLPEQGLTGAAAAAGYALGRTEDPRLGAVVRAQGTAGPVRQPVEVLASLSLRDAAGEPHGVVKAGIRNRALTVEMRTDYRLGETVSLPDLVVEAPGSRLDGDLVLRPDGLVVGSLKGTVEDLQPWSELAGMPLAGRFGFDGQLRPESGQGVRADLRGSNLRIGDTQIGGLQGRLDLADLLSAPQGRATLTATGVAAGGARIARAVLDGSGNGRSVDFTLDAGGPAAEPLAVQARGSYVPQPEAHLVQLVALRFRYGGEEARLEQPTRITVGAAGVRLAPAVLAVGRGRLALAGSVADGALDLSLEADRLPVALVGAFMPGQELSGTLDGELRVSGTMSAPQAVAQLRGRALGFAGGEQRIDVGLDGRWAAGLVQLEAEATGIRGASARATASFPLVVREGLSIPETGALRARIVANGDVEQITDALPLAGHRFAGTMRADIQVGGTVQRPAVDGEARLDDGFYQFFDTGTVIRDIEARLTARDSESFDVRLRGTDGRRGSIAATGSIRTGGRGAAYDVATDIRDFRLIDLDGATAQGSGTLNLTGLGSDGALTGRIAIGPAEYDIGGALPGGSVPTLDVVEINKPGAPQMASLDGRRQPARDDEAPEPATPLTIGLNIQADVDRLFVRGKGLESVWAGDLSAGGTLSQPSIVGVLRAQRGTYAFLGRDFRLADSRVVFDGGSKIEPRLDVLAEAQARDLTAQVRVAGSVSAPQFDFTSNPPYPKDEILSRLLFGRSMGQLSVGQQIQIARAAASLAGGGGGFDPIGSIRQGLGLDLLDVGAGDEEGGLSPRVSAGKYLDDDTFLRVEEGGREGGEVSIERQIGRGLSVEADVGRRGGGGVGLNWRRDY